MLTGRFGASAVVLLLAVAVMLWPVVTLPPGRRAGAPRPRRGSLVGAAARAGWVIGSGAVLLTGLSAGWPVGIAAALAAATVLRLTTTALRRRRVRADRAALGVVLGALCRELRAGTSVREALELATTGAGSALSAQLRSVVLQAHRSGRPSTAVGGIDPLENLAAALRISDLHGVPLADLVAVIADDSAHTAAAEEARGAQTAGPRFSGYVLGALPVFGVLLGSGIGADPIAVLTGGGTAGSVLLVVGTALVAAGLLWSAKIVAG